MAKRLSKSAPLAKYNELTVKIKQCEMDLESTKEDKIKEVHLHTSSSIIDCMVVFINNMPLVWT